MERLRYTLGRLNTTAIGLILVGLAVALFVVPRFMAAPAPAPNPGGPAAPPALVAPQPNGPEQWPAPPAAGPEQRPAPPAPQAAGPEQRPAPPAAGPEQRPQVGPARVPPAPPHSGWMDTIGQWFLHQLAFTGGMTTLAGLLLIGFLLWRGLTQRQGDVVKHL